MTLDILITDDNKINDYIDIKLPHTKTLDENIINAINFILNIKILINNNFIDNILLSSDNTFNCIIILIIVILFLILLENIL
jgi:hypothetical protein